VLARRGERERRMLRVSSTASHRPQ
jgi:hypothetical protein